MGSVRLDRSREKEARRMIIPTVPPGGRDKIARDQQAARTPSFNHPAFVAKIRARTATVDTILLKLMEGGLPRGVAKLIMLVNGLRKRREGGGYCQTVIFYPSDENILS